MSVGYQPEKKKKPHYWCDTHLFEEREQPCFGLKAPPLDELVAQADALEIEAQAKRRLASEYDAAQERGEVQTDGRPKTAPRAAC